MSMEERLAGWQPIETAPYGTPVEIRVGRMTMWARLQPGVSEDEDGNSVDQWQAEYEGEHPPCWSGGACWASNEDEIESIQPTAWLKREGECPTTDSRTPPPTTEEPR